MQIAAVHQMSEVATAPTPQPSPERIAEQRELIQAVKAINASELLGEQSELTFVLDRATQRAVIRIVDRETRQVIRQIPDADILSLAKQLNYTGLRG